MTTTAKASTLQDEHEIANLMTGWIYRDVGDWDSLRGLFHEEARITVSWFSGLAADFVDASARMGGSDFRTKHLIAAPAISFSPSGRRAVSETNAIVVGENRRLSLGAVTHNRFIDRVERRAGRWGIVDRASIYDFSSFTFPLGIPETIDRDAVAKFPAEYAALAYLLEASGFPVHGTFTVKNSDQEREIRSSASQWLDQSETAVPSYPRRGIMTYSESSDRADVFVSHKYEEHIVDLGEIRMNYAVAGNPHHPAVLLIPAQTESWWGYEQAMTLLSGSYQVYAVDLRGQGRSTWTPGRYSLDIFGGDLIRFIDRVIGRPVIVSGLSSGGTIAAWLSAFAAPGQVVAAVYEDSPLFASEANPSVGPSVRQGMGPMFRLWHKWLGSQWSIGDYAGMQAALPRELPAWMLAALKRMSGDTSGAAAPPDGQVPQDLREYDPEWGDAFASGRATENCDHANMLSHVRVPVLFTHHFRHVDASTGNILGALSDLQVARVRELVESAGNSFTYRSFPDMPHSMHGHDPATYAATVTEWLDALDLPSTNRNA
jgi:pimeloyl-ACP methyl ester carboxylesterase